jgi:7-keto-8-aminopelargonate synthetase-like enzyme
MSSNDYLGLSAHPKVLLAAREAAETFGAGTGGAPGTTGTTVLHQRLAHQIASFKSREVGALFPSGYQANQSLHQALDSERTVFYVDNRHHPSALDGVRLARSSRLTRFDHNDLDTLRGAVLAHRNMNNIVTLPSVFTVDGDIAPLDDIVKLKNELGFLLILDEAHATGCLGATGRGLEEHYGLKGAADFIMGTFSKALGSQGGFLAYDLAAAGHLKGEFRAREYSTSLAAPSAAAALAALELVQGDPSHLASLRRNKELIIETCRKADLRLIHKESMVLLLPVADGEALQAGLFDGGYLAITVKARLAGEAMSCLRIIPMATHTEKDIVGFVAALKRNL